jgi:PAS domain S-box-containing protein
MTTPDDLAAFSAPNPLLRFRARDARSPARTWLRRVFAARARHPSSTSLASRLDGSSGQAQAEAGAPDLPRRWWQPWRLERGFDPNQTGAAARDPGEIRFALRVTDDGFVFEAVNSVFEASTGLSAAEIIGRTPAEVLPPVVAEPIIARCRRCLLQAAPIRFIQALPLPTGRRHWETTLAPHRDAHGRLTLILATAREVSERLETEIALAQTSEGFSPEGETVRSLQFRAFPDGRPDYVSPFFYEYSGLAPGLAGASLLAAAVHPEDRERITPGGDPSQPDRAFEADIRLRRHDGVYRWFRLRTELVDGLAGRGWYGVATDIHDLRPPPMPPERPTERVSNVLAGFSGRSVTIDSARRITSFTPEAAAWAGLEGAELLGVDARERLPIPRAPPAGPRGWRCRT